MRNLQGAAGFVNCACIFQSRDFQAQTFHAIWIFCLDCTAQLKDKIIPPNKSTHIHKRNTTFFFVELEPVKPLQPWSVDGECNALAPADSLSHPCPYKGRHRGKSQCTTKPAALQHLYCIENYKSLCSYNRSYKIRITQLCGQSYTKLQKAQPLCLRRTME